MKPTNIYQIRVKGHLEEEWSDWFEGMEITHLKNGESSITGFVVDQPALFGLLLKVNRLNLTLLSVNVVSTDT